MIERGRQVGKCVLRIDHRFDSGLIDSADEIFKGFAVADLNAFNGQVLERQRGKMT